MRISISHHTLRKGLLFKKTYHEVHLVVAFTHEEKQIIKQRGLLKTKLIDRRPADAKNDARDEKFELRIEHLMDGKTDSFLCATPSKSKIYEEAVMDTLNQMKLWLNDNADTASGFTVEI